jgi:hypothetical protein
VPAVSNTIVALGAPEFVTDAEASVVVEVHPQFINAAESGSAVPVPVPTPVAVKTVPTVLLEAPTLVKLVVPRLTIWYCWPVTKDPATVAAGLPV